MTDSISVLEQLRPTARSRVMDLVSEAGVDVREWRNSPAGAANPKFCYEWAFVEPGVVVVANLAHRDIIERHGKVLQPVDIGDLERGYAAGNATRKRRLDMLARALDLAYQEELPLRVIVFDGELGDEAEGKPTCVDARMLDLVAWAVTTCDPIARRYVLSRGASPVRFIDQFTQTERDGGAPERREVVTYAFARSAIVRRRARQHANGKCEFCGEPGFVASNGEIYLETHHVQPLGEGGSDTEDNVVGLCANHHREAHLGENRLAMKAALVEQMSKGSAHG